MSPLVGCPGPGWFLSGGSFAPGHFCPGGLCPFPPPKFNAYTHHLGFLCLASWRDGQTKKNGSIACYRCNRIYLRWALFPRGYFARGTFGRGDFLSGRAFVRGVFCPGGLLAGRACPVFCPGGLLSGGLMPIPPKFNAYTHRLGFLCLAS